MARVWRGPAKGLSGERAQARQRRPLPQRPGSQPTREHHPEATKQRTEKHRRGPWHTVGELERLAAEYPADRRRARPGQNTGDHPQHGKFRQQGMAQVPVAGAQGAQHGERLFTFVMRGLERRPQHHYRPASTAKPNTNCTTAISRSIIDCTCARTAVTSMTERFGKAPTDGS